MRSLCDNYAIIMRFVALLNHKIAIFLQNTCTYAFFFVPLQAQYKYLYCFRKCCIKIIE